MSTPLSQILGLTLIPVFATILGGAIATFRTPSEKLRSLVQHFAAGVVLAVVAGELLSEMTREHRPVGVVIGFVLGVALMLGVKAVTERIEGRSGSSGDSKAGLLTAVGIDVFLDGLLIGVGFAAGERVGTLLVIALTLELLFLGISVAASLAEAKFPRSRNILTVTGLAGVVVVGACV